MRAAKRLSRERPVATSSRNVSSVDAAPLWWPPAKIVGRHLAPFLAEQLGIADEFAGGAPEGAIAVNVQLDAVPVA